MSWSNNLVLEMEDSQKQREFSTQALLWRRMTHLSIPWSNIFITIISKLTLLHNHNWGIVKVHESHLFISFHKETILQHLISPHAQCISEVSYPLSYQVNPLRSHIIIPIIFISLLFLGNIIHKWHRQCEFRWNSVSYNPTPKEDVLTCQR